MIASRTSRDGSRSIGDKFRGYRSVRWLALGVFVALSFVLAACAPSSRTSQPPARAPQAEGEIVNVAARISGFTLDRTSVNAGTVTFVVENDDSMPHDFMIQGNGVQERTGRIAPGKTASLTVDLKPGTYNYVCTMDGHGQVMHGTVTAK